MGTSGFHIEYRLHFVNIDVRYCEGYAASKMQLPRKFISELLDPASLLALQIATLYSASRSKTWIIEVPTQWCLLGDGKLGKQLSFASQ